MSRTATRMPMSRNHEKLLIAALAGLVICGAAAMVVQPVVANASTTRAGMQPIEISVLALDPANA